jgi:hypothetical protein
VGQHDAIVPVNEIGIDLEGAIGSPRKKIVSLVWALVSRQPDLGRHEALKFAARCVRGRSAMSVPTAKPVIAVVHESVNGTNPTCRGSLTMSVDRGKPEGAGPRSK